jgi:hypothetical protein
MNIQLYLFLLSVQNGNKWPNLRRSHFIPPLTGKELRHPLNRKLGETHNKTANFGEEINLSPVPRINHNSADVQNVVSNHTD